MPGSPTHSDGLLLGPYGEKPTTKRSRGIGSWSRKKKLVVFGALGALVLLALILGLAIGLTVGRNKSNKPSPGPDDNSKVPAAVGGTRDDLLRQGLYYTSTSNKQRFNWTTADPGLRAYRADSQGVDAIIDTSTQYQTMDGFGAAMTDTSAYLFNGLKTDKPLLYGRVMDFLFSNATGLQVTRASMGSSDFSVNGEYTYIPTGQGPTFDTAATERTNVDSLLSSFSLDNTETSQNTIPVLRDALDRNPDLKIILTPWSPPAFMKTNNRLNSGSLRDGFIPALAAYYVRTVQAFTDAGVRPWAITLQNEPSHLASFPSMGMNAIVQSDLASELKNQLAAANLRDINVFGHDDNYSGYDSAASIVNQNATAVDAVAFHCYRGTPDQMANFSSSLQNNVRKDIHMTECTGTEAPTSEWNSIQSWLSRVFFPVTSYNAKSLVMWNLALDSENGPHLPDSYCSDCTGGLTISDQANPTNPYLALNSQAFLIAHFSSATTDLTNVGGGPASRVNLTFPGPQYSLDQSDTDCFAMQAFAAPLNAATLPTPSNQSDAQPQRRVSLVVENQCSSTKALVISSDGRRSTLQVQPGLTTFIWTAP